MKEIVNFLSMIGELVTSIITSIIDFFVLLANSVTDVVSVFQYMPSYILYGITAVLTIGLIKTIITHGGSSI